jgi:hypothetical protein
MAVNPIFAKLELFCAKSEKEAKFCWYRQGAITCGRFD